LARIQRQGIATLRGSNYRAAKKEVTPEQAHSQAAEWDKKSGHTRQRRVTRRQPRKYECSHGKRGTALKKNSASQMNCGRSEYIPVTLNRTKRIFDHQNVRFTDEKK